MNQPQQSETDTKKTSAVLDHVSVLPEALLRHVEAGRLDEETARDLAEELTDQAESIAHRRNSDRLSNLLFLDNLEMYETNRVDYSKLIGLPNTEIEKHIRESIHNGPLIDPENAVFHGGKAEIGNFLFAIASAAKERFKMDSHDMLRNKHDIAFDFGHVDQFADWDAPLDLDALIECATDITVLAEEFPAAHPSVVLHTREHPKLHYKFLRPAMTSRPSIMVIRQRPYADEIFEIDGEQVCVQIFRKSWFLVTSSEQEDPELCKQIMKARNGQANNDALTQLIDDVLASTDKHEQATVLPCTMTYVARVEDPRHTKVDKEKSKHRDS